MIDYDKRYKKQGKQENRSLLLFLLLKTLLVSYNIYLLICGDAGIYWMGLKQTTWIEY